MTDGFLNPYNFINIPEKKSGKYKHKDLDFHTGVIEYRITTKTPLFIPNTSNDNAFCLLTEPENDDRQKREPHPSYDFFSYQELENGKDYRGEDNCHRPVIPGSELRGMFRNIYETLTGSCMSVLNGEEYPVRRIGEAFKPGLIKRINKDGIQYKLYSATDHVYRTNIYYKTFEKTSYREGQKLYFNKDDVDQSKRKPVVWECCETESSQYQNYGFLIKGMSDQKIGKKRNAHLFVPKESFKSLRVDDLDRLEAVLKAYQNQTEKTKNSYKEYENALKDFREGRGEDFFPVYFSKISDGSKQLLYLAPACFTKEMSHYSINDLVGKGMATCKTVGSCCPACDLFGMIGNDSQGSKIRFSDAQPEKDKMDRKDYYYNDGRPITLQTLGEPKLGNTEFYLQRPKGAEFWTYDYYIDENLKLHICEGKLRGRKFYWHQPDVKLPKGVERTKFNKTVRPVNENISFVGKLYFDGITQKQLNQLLWILDGGMEEGRTERLAYKLGSGKPLGLGSVECSVIQKTEREIKVNGTGFQYIINPTEREELEIPRYEDVGFVQECKKEFELISSFSATEGLHVTYPVTLEQKDDKPMTEGFQWFVSNHQLYDKKKSVYSAGKMSNNRREYTRLVEYLPLITEYQNLLPYIIPSGYLRRNKIYTGTIAKYSENRLGINVLIDSHQIFIHVSNLGLNKQVTLEDLKKEFTEGKKIQFTYCGKKQIKNRVVDEFKDVKLA